MWTTKINQKNNQKKYLTSKLLFWGMMLSMMPVDSGKTGREEYRGDLENSYCWDSMCSGMIPLDSVTNYSRQPAQIGQEMEFFRLWHFQGNQWRLHFQSVSTWCASAQSGDARGGRRRARILLMGRYCDCCRFFFSGRSYAHSAALAFFL